jgi:hypothetical protein
MFVLAFLMSRQPEAKMKCPHCHGDIIDDEPVLFLGEQAFHCKCWVRAILGPTEKRVQATTPLQDTDPVISAGNKKRVV